MVFTILLFREWEEGDVSQRKAKRSALHVVFVSPNVRGGWLMESFRLMYSYTKKNLLLHHTQ